MADLLEISNGVLRAQFRHKGAALHALYFEGCAHSIVFGGNDPAIYVAPQSYMGTIVGIVANRIANAQFELGEHTHHVNANWRGHTLHGGHQGLSELEWELRDHQPDAIIFAIKLADGHMGFPGPVDVTASYRFIGNALEIDIQATPQQPSPINIAPHIYFNLDCGGTIAEHSLKVCAANYLPIDHDCIPTGSPATVDSTPFDFLNSKPIGNHPMDHNFCLDPSAMYALEYSNGKITMRMSTNQHGVQIYNGIHFDTLDFEDWRGEKWCFNSAIAIEPQGWPNAINETSFPSTLVDAGETYQNISRFLFSKS